MILENNQNGEFSGEKRNSLKRLSVLGWFLELKRSDLMVIGGTTQRSDMAVSKNRGGPPKWMVYFMENPMNKWMICGYHSFWSATHILYMEYTVRG